jgi:hypothetical protein
MAVFRDVFDCLCDIVNPGVFFHLRLPGLVSVRGRVRLHSLRGGEQEEQGDQIFGKEFFHHPLCAHEFMTARVHILSAVFFCADDGVMHIRCYVFFSFSYFIVDGVIKCNT